MTEEKDGGKDDKGRGDAGKVKAGLRVDEEEGV